MVSCIPRGTDLAGEFAAPPALSTVVSFATLKAEVLEPKCLQCHSAFATESGIAPYLVPGNPGQSALYADIVSGSMPMGSSKLPDVDAELTKNYILGLVNPSPDPSPSATPSSEGTSQPVGQASGEPTSAPSAAPSSVASNSPIQVVSFAALKAQVLSKYSCLGCHSSFSNASGLTPYIVAKDPEHSPLYKALVNESMPPDGPAPSSDDKQMVHDYILGL